MSARADVELACRTTARLLISAAAPDVASTLARRVHDTSLRARFPLVHASAVELPSEKGMLRETCGRLLAAGAGGTLMISDIDQLPRTAQDHLVDVLEELEGECSPSNAVRVITWTTTPLLDRVAAGTFSEQLFYRLNLIHLMMIDG